MLELLRLGMDPYLSSGDSFENGDGWGSLNSPRLLLSTLLRQTDAPKRSQFWCNMVLTCLRKRAGTAVLSLHLQKKRGDYWYTNGHTALQLAVRANQPEVVKLIVKHAGVDVLEKKDSENSD